MAFKNKKNFIHSRRQAREKALQALYQWEITQLPITEIIDQFKKHPGFSAVDQAYFMDVLNGLISENNTTQKTVNQCIQRYIDRPSKEIDPVELSLLKMATFELLEKKDVPYKVILNEALELSKKFGATLSHKFINGVLDKIAREVRRQELKAHGPRAYKTAD